jgi:hypothetical protein
MSLLRTLGLMTLVTFSASPMVLKAGEVALDQMPVTSSNGAPWDGSFIPATRLLTPDGAVREGAVSNDERNSRIAELLRRTAENARRRAIKTPSAPCFWPAQPGDNITMTHRPGTAGSKAPPHKPTWSERVQHTHLTVVGRVVALTPGLDLHTVTPATLVTVRIERFLRGNGNGVTTLTYLARNSSLRINGVNVCMEDPGEEALSEGDRVIVSGWVEQKSPNGLHLFNWPTLDVFQVQANGTARLIGQDGQAQTFSIAELQRAINAMPQPEELPQVRQ